MKKLAGGLTAIAVAASGLALSAPAANAAPGIDAYSAGTWLNDQLTDGVYHDSLYSYDNYGLAIDTYFALKDLKTRPATQATIIGRLTDDIDTYLDAAWGYPTGSAGKAATAIKAAGGNPSNVNGTDIIADMEANTDDATGESANTYGGVGQAWATRGLVAGNSVEKTKSVDFLLSKQAASGLFAQNYADGTTSVDATAYAVLALKEAKSAGITGLDDDLAEAQSGLVAAQAADGSFDANANSTGLGSIALAALGDKAAADSAARWIAARQVTLTNSDATSLADEVGAIAWKPASFTTAATDGITIETISEWMLATAQSAGALVNLLPAASATVTTDAQASAGAGIPVTVSGLVAGEKFTAAISDGTSVSGTVPATGAATVTVTAPAGTATRTITVTGANAGRVGTATVRVLAAKKLTVKVAKTKVKKNKTNKVTVSGLDAGESVKVIYAGKTVKTGKANAAGVYKATVKVGKKTGKKKVKVVGAFTNRAGSKTFRVKK